MRYARIISSCQTTGRRAIGERIMREGKELKNLKDLIPDAIKLGYDFSVALQERDNQRAIEILIKIEQLDTI